MLCVDTAFVMQLQCFGNLTPPFLRSFRHTPDAHARSYFLQINSGILRFETRNRNALLLFMQSRLCFSNGFVMRDPKQICYRLQFLPD